MIQLYSKVIQLYQTIELLIIKYASLHIIKNGVVAVYYELLRPFKTVTNYWAKKVTAARQSLDGYFFCVKLM